MITASVTSQNWGEKKWGKKMKNTPKKKKQKKHRLQ
jgi:hypothetical protein